MLNGNFTQADRDYQPIYMAGYIQDKFAFKDLIFNIGLRVDRFDANQLVLKDPYLFYPAKTAGEVNQIERTVRYIIRQTSAAIMLFMWMMPTTRLLITGYRNGEQLVQCRR